MNDLSKKMKMEYKAQQKVEHILTANQAAALFEYLEVHIQEEGCNHSRRFTQAWLDENINFMLHDAILTELDDMGGYCDCEVLLNCYEDYAL